MALIAKTKGTKLQLARWRASNQPWWRHLLFGQEQSGQNVYIDDNAGGAWYVLNNTPNGLPDENNRVLLVRLSTSGELNGILNTQIFQNGNGSNALYYTYTFDGQGTFAPNGFGSENACGCTDSEASNYDATAAYDDGSCTYSVMGCTDSTACNYESNATEDDGSCTYAETGYDCEGARLNDADGDEICDEFEVAGCTDVTACNYNVEATDDDGPRLATRRVRCMWWSGHP